MQAKPLMRARFYVSFTQILVWFRIKFILSMTAHVLDLAFFDSFRLIFSLAWQLLGHHANDRAFRTPSRVRGQPKMGGIRPIRVFEYIRCIYKLSLYTCRVTLLCMLNRIFKWLGLIWTSLCSSIFLLNFRILTPFLAEKPVF